MRWLSASAVLLFSVSASASDGGTPVYQPPAGVNIVLEGPIEAAPNHHLVMGDLVMGPGGTIPRHTHTGEEFLCVMGGSTTVSREGHPDVVLTAGQGMRIEPGVVHWGHAGEEGVRGVSSWVVKNGQPLRTPAE